MALIKCEECGKEISDRAVACPNCGCPIEHKKQIVKKTSHTNADGKRNMPAMVCLFISHLMGFAYSLYSIIYWSTATSGTSGFEKVGAGIATFLVVPHVIVAIIATIFNFAALFAYRRGLTLTAAILYAVSAVLFPLYCYFVMIQSVLCFIAFALMKKPIPQQN